jgi:ELWxxDGT repeat protein
MSYPCRRALQALTFLLTFTILFPTLALSHPTAPALVRDINPGLNPKDWWASPQLFIDWKGAAYFYNIDSAHGAEMWRTDGTEEGTYLLKDILPGPLGSDAGSSRLLTEDSFYFYAFDRNSNFHLWKSDGTEAGTVPFLPGFGGSVRPFLVGDTLYFLRGCRETPCELWKSDGTIAGTVKVTSFMPPSGDPGFVPNANAVSHSDGPLFFFLVSHDPVQELWRSDGTEAGTFPVRSATVPAVAGGLISGAVQVGGTLLFNGWDETGGRSLWRSDGTVEGTVPLLDVSASDMKLIDGTVYLFVRNSPALELWKSDGTEAGTVQVKDFVPGLDYGSMIGKVGGNILLLVWNPEAGFEIWKTDGSAEGTLLVRDIVPGVVDGSIDNVTIANGLLFFSIDDGVHGMELWKSDGTAEGTALVRDIVPGPGSPTIMAPGEGAGKLFFWGDDGVHGHELWMSDGTEEGTVPLKDFVQAKSSVPFGLTVSGDHLFFTATDGSHGYELWKTDGTAEGTVLTHDIFPGPSPGSSTYPFNLTDVEGTLYFNLAWDELWKTDGTPGGLTLEQEGTPINGMAEAGGRLFLNTGELHVAGSGLVKDIRPGPGGSQISEMTEMGDTLFFRADDGGGAGLWRSDGTAATTFEVAPVAAHQLTVVGNALFFIVVEESSWIYSLWRSDGTSAGTVQIASWSPGDFPHELTAVNGTLFLGLSLQAGGEELWRSNGTAAGTVRVRRVSDSRSPLAELTSVSGNLFFTAEDAGGRELWKSDGTEAGTLRVKDVFPGPRGSHPALLVDAGGRLVFAATDPVHGREVWVSDGTPGGTFLVGDVAPGESSSWPEELTLWKGKVYFSADDGTSGVELWSFELEEPATTDTAPDIQDLVVNQGPDPVGTPVTMSVLFVDPDPDQAHTVIWEWGDGTDSGEELPPGPGGSRSVSSTHFYTEPGFYRITVRVTDETGRSATAFYEHVIAYDLKGPSVKGAGWLPLVQGKGTFQLDASYKAGGLAPQGQAQFKASGVSFRSQSFDLLVVQGPTAWLTGEGAVNGRAGYSFWIMVTDGQANDGGGVDRVRVWIQESGTGRLIFDNEPGRAVYDPPVTALGGGTIQIRSKGKEKDKDKDKG